MVRNQVMGNKIKIVISLPNEGHTEVQAYANRLSNFKALGNLEVLSKGQDTEFEFLPLTLGGILTPLAREEAAKVCLESEADYLFMIDDDMICPNDLFQRLYRHNVD